MKIILVLFLATYLGESYAGQIYKCNVNGNTVFTDKKCDGELVGLKASNSISSDSVEGFYNSSSWYTGYSGYMEALKVSEENKVPIFLYFQADWCGYCRKLEKEIFSTDRGELTLRRVIKVNISPEAGHEERKLFEGLGGTGYPTVFIQKRFDVSPSRLSFMERVSGKWKTKSVDYLVGVIESSVKSAP